MARTCTFARGATSVALRAPRYPEPGGYAPTQLVGRTWGGAFKIADLGTAGTPRHELRLEFVNLKRDEWDSLRGFPATTCGWATNAFTYSGRGRDRPHGRPPAQIPACGATSACGPMVC